MHYIIASGNFKAQKWSRDHPHHLKSGVPPSPGLCHAFLPHRSNMWWSPKNVHVCMGGYMWQSPRNVNVCMGGYMVLHVCTLYVGCNVWLKTDKFLHVCGNNVLCCGVILPSSTDPQCSQVGLWFPARRGMVYYQGELI